MRPMTTSEARAAVHQSWANTTDRAARLAPARAGLLARFERIARDNLGPAATDSQVAAAAESARSAHYARMAAASVKARRNRGASA
jgi:hypothetical protein